MVRMEQKSRCKVLKRKFFQNLIKIRYYKNEVGCYTCTKKRNTEWGWCQVLGKHSDGLFATQDLRKPIALVSSCCSITVPAGMCVGRYRPVPNEVS
jgi:hypothetical protein